MDRPFRGTLGQLLLHCVACRALCTVCLSILLLSFFEVDAHASRAGLAQPVLRGVHVHAGGLGPMLSMLAGQHAVHEPFENRSLKTVGRVLPLSLDCVRVCLKGLWFVRLLKAQMLCSWPPFLERVTSPCSSRCPLPVPTLTRPVIDHLKYLKMQPVQVGAVMRGVMLRHTWACVH
eukprot:365272-Chlamydomonas_euryale.AAC.12